MIAATTKLRDLRLESRPIDFKLAHGGRGRDFPPFAIFIAPPALFEIAHDFISLVGLIVHGFGSSRMICTLLIIMMPPNGLRMSVPPCRSKLVGLK